MSKKRLPTEQQIEMMLYTQQIDLASGRKPLHDRPIFESWTARWFRMFGVHPDMEAGGRDARVGNFNRRYP